MKMDHLYINGTYHTILQLLHYVLPTLVHSFGASGEYAAKLYTMVGHYTGILCQKAGGDPYEVLGDFKEIVAEALAKSIRTDEEDDVDYAANLGLEITAAGYAFVRDAIKDVDMSDEQVKNCTEAWLFLTCLTFSLVAVIYGQEEASKMSYEVTGRLVKERVLHPTFAELVFNEKTLPERFFDNAIHVTRETSGPDYLSKFFPGSN